MTVSMVRTCDYCNKVMMSFPANSTAAVNSTVTVTEWMNTSVTLPTSTMPTLDMCDDCKAERLQQ